MAATWKLNGTEISLLPVGRLELDLVNQQPDALRFEKTEVEFDLATAYTSTPTLAITGGGGTGAAGTAAVSGGVVSSLTLTNAGSGYTSPPDVAIVGGGGFGATAIARLTGTSLAGIYVNEVGSGYTSAPVVIISGGGGSGAAATAVLATRSVASVTITNGGTGFTSAPTVSFTGGGGTGAAGTAVLSGGSVVSLTLTNGGTGYTSAPTVSFTGGGGTGAAATAVLATRAVASAALSAAGAGFLTPPAVSLAGGGGTGAAITANLTPTTLLGITVTNPGSGYTSAPTIAITGGGGSGATAVAVLSSGAVTGIVVTNGGSGYTSRALIAITGGGGSGATASCVFTATGVAAVFPDAAAVLGWAGTPTVSFTGGGGSGAAATATVDGIVYGLALTNAGSGYTSRPTVTISGGGGADAEGWAEVNPINGTIAKIVLLRRGTGYTSTPTVTISGGGGSGGTAIAYYSQALVEVEVTSAGTGYTSSPTAVFTYGSDVRSGSTTLVGTSIASVVMSAGGAGYTSAPTVTITASNAFGRAELYPEITAGAVTDIFIRDIDDLGRPMVLGGVGYTSAPAITVFAYTGSGATATATLTSGAISSIAINTAGSGYLYPYQVSAYTIVPQAGSGATATASIGVVVESIALTNAGTGYTTVPTVGFSGGGGSGAAATAVLTPTSLASLTVTNGGSGYTSAPTITIAEPTGTGASTATATATLAAAAVASLSLTNGGSNYTSAPTVGFTGGGGSGAAATAAVAVAVASVTITNAGTGYTSAPTVGFSGGGGSGAAGTAVLTSAGIVSFTLTNAGSGYTTAPTISLSGGGGSGAEPYAELTATTVAALVITNNGGVLPFDSVVVLTREEAGIVETWFVGAVRETPRRRNSRDNAIEYVALGPWQWLERIPFLQTFKQASDPDNPASTLEDYQRGRVVIAQDDDGLKVSLGEFLNLVLDYAIGAKPGVMQRADFSGLDLTIPWDEAIDLSCAEVISRVLQFLPDAVCWWDYSYSPPLLNITRRADMTAIELPVQPSGAADDADAYAPIEAIELRERADLRKTGVYLLYLATNRANQTSWEKATPDVYPPGTVASDPDTLFRTIQLAGAVTQSTELAQRVDVDPIPSDLVYATASWLTSGAQFDALRTWWFNHAKELHSSYITIKGFYACTREGDTVGTDAQLDNELVSGAITDWMEEKHNITSEDQTITAFIAFEEARPNDSSKKARHIKKFVAVIKATNAQTKTYRFSEDLAFTPAEEVPVGLAEAIYGAISVPHFDGAVQLIEREASYRILVGRVLNLTGSLAAWETMAALVQRARINIDRGVTQIQVGPPRQLGPDDLTELYRVNRNRAPVTSYTTRTTGLSGGGGGATGTQGLGRHHRGGARASGVAQAPARYTSAITVAGTVATNTEIATAVAAAYSGVTIPVEGDIVSLTVGGVVKFTAIVTLTAISTDGWRRVSFSFSSVTYYAWVQQVGLY